MSSWIWNLFRKRHRRVPKAAPPPVRVLARDYERLCGEVCDAIRRSERPQKYYYLSLGMSRSTWHRRLRAGRWTLAELGQLMGLLGMEA
ncbi:MAG: hypothetical protein D6722_24830 [Bacteroidetes bacterium]|nr:MAG: hypothetical protein D6722_24830 [Bacteroidota bacterium]